jgi:hypothetical protein
VILPGRQRIESSRFRVDELAALLAYRNERLRRGPVDPRFIGDGTLNSFGPSGFGNFNDGPIILPVQVPLDPTSNKGVPLTQAEWNAAWDAASRSRRTLAHSWSFQDTRAPAVATGGTNLTASVGLSYSVALSGWTRVGIGLNAGGAQGTENLSFVGGTHPTPQTESAAWIGYINFVSHPSTVNDNSMMSAWDSTTTNRCSITALRNTTKLRLYCGSSTADSTLSHSGIHPFVLVYDRTNGTVTFYSDIEKIVGTYTSSGLNTQKGFPSSFVPPDMVVFWAAAFSGSDAEWSSTDVKALLTSGLGWTVTGW